MAKALLIGCVEASRRLGVCVATVKAWADAGEIPLLRDSARRRLFFASDVDALAKRRGGAAAKSKAKRVPRGR